MPQVRGQPITLNSENLNPRPGKNAPIKQLACIKANRPALGDVGNTVGNVQKNPTAKPALALPQKLVNAPKQNVVKKEKKATLIITPPIQSPKLKLERVDKKCEQIAFSTKQLSDVEEQQEKGDPLMVVEYVQDIYRYLRDLEVQYSIKPNFLANHKTSPRMRSVLINWIVEAHADFSYLLETLHLAVSLIDRYLQVDLTVDRSNLQLVGVSALWVAAKYEEMYVPNLKDFIYITDNAFTEPDMKKMEQKILKALDWRLGRPLGIHFLKRYSKLVTAHPKEYVLGKYLLELALVQYETCHVNPSLMAAAAVCLSVAIVRELKNPSEVWTDRMTREFTYQYTDFRVHTIQLAQVLLKQDTNKHQAVKKKYSEAKMFKISQNPVLNCNLVKTLAIKGVKKP